MLPRIEVPSPGSSSQGEGGLRPRRDNPLPRERVRAGEGLATGRDHRLLAIYIHWPFCRSKCPYCDFNSHVRASIDEARWRRAYLTELDNFAAETEGRRVASVFFGGGTPSLMRPETTAAILDHVASRWPLAADLEVTLEANPSTAEAARFRGFREAGVDRLSIGVQALDDDALRFLGRGHSVAEARAAVDLAAVIFPRFSFDLIWGWPGHELAAWRRQLGEGLAMAGDHLSAYQLTIEPGTAFWREGVPAAGEDTGVALYEITQEVLAGAGLAAYEISNHARPAGECRHNLAIWRGTDYLGIGPGAHGRLSCDGGMDATRAIRAPEKWLAKVEARGHGLAERVPLAPSERREELLLLGLRLTRGLERDRFRALAGVEPEDAVDRMALARLVDGGFIAADAAGLRATSTGRLRLNAVLAQLLA
jgi:putative oxygen-independent coproporphyrinogen III oxidase